MHPRSRTIVALAAIAGTWLAPPALAQNERAGTGATTPPAEVALRVEGSRLIDENGNTAILRGINIGNWFLIEPWMYAQFYLPDEASFLSLLEARFGAAAADALIETHRDNWITQRDFDSIANSGFNTVRIPFHYRMVEQTPLVIDETGMQRLVDAVDMAEQAGLYVVIDLHAAPGGQSLDGPSGDRTLNDLWTDAAAQERTVWLWQSIARRLKNKPNLVAYDLLNEPYGDFNTDITSELLDIMDRAIEAIRVVDPNRLILVPATLEGLRFYGDPADRGWTNVGFTEHFYPGLFDGQPPTLGTLARFARGELRDRVALADRYNVPFFLGEINPVFDRAGGPFAMRDIFDEAQELGTHSAVWAYKLLKPQPGVQPDNWYLATNAGPLPFSDLRNATLGNVQQLFNSLDTMPLETDGEYVGTLLNPAHQRILPEVDLLPLEAPANDQWQAWTSTDIGNVAIPGGQAVGSNDPLGADSLTLYASGQDLFGTRDSLRLVSRAMPPSYIVSGVFDAFEGGRFAQAGVTARRDETSGSPHVSLVAFPDGRILVKSRSFANANTSQRHLTTAGFPVGLGLERSGNSYTAWITNDTGEWTAYPLNENPSLGTSPRGGFFAIANRHGPLSVVDIANPSLDFPPDIAPPPTLDTGVNLLANPSFEAATSPEAATSWNRTGNNFSRQTGWTPTRQGNALLAYRHWEAGSNPSSVEQTLSGLTPGAAYVWTVYANRDTVSGGQSLADRVELRVEVPGPTTRWLESVEHAVSEIETDDDWSRLQVRFVATQPQHVVRLIAYPAQSGNRDGAVKFDTFFLTPSPD